MPQNKDDTPLLDEVGRIAAGLTEAQRIEEARAFLDRQLARSDTVLTPDTYYRLLGDLVACIPPFRRPKFHTRRILTEGHSHGE